MRRGNCAQTWCSRTSVQWFNMSNDILLTATPATEPLHFLTAAVTSGANVYEFKR